LIYRKLDSDKMKLNFIAKALKAVMLFSNCMMLYAQVNIPSPSSGFDRYRSDVEHGKNEIVSYYSNFVGVSRNTRVYLPPGYTEDSTYNVLYLLHGIGGDINEWYNLGVPHYILDNLFAKGYIAPMIVVLPNGRAMEDDSPGSDIFAPEKQEGFANFEYDLIGSLIPFIDTTYSVKPGREARAIAGLSMGGGQALNFGLAHLDTFAWIGAFSPAPNTKAADQLIPNLEEDSSKISALWLSCGSADGLLSIAENTHNFMSENNIEHFYLVEDGMGHDWSVWKPGLYHFVQRIFGVEPIHDTGTTIINPPASIYQNKSISSPGFFYNPSSQTITLIEEGSFENLRIYDMNGRLKLSKTKIDNKIVNIGHLPKGVYLVVLFDGSRNIQRKIVKQ
jgi:enterochelin esterase-like enzyme